MVIGVFRLALVVKSPCIRPDPVSGGRGLVCSGAPATIEEPEGQTKQPAPQALPTNNADPQVGVGGLTDGGRGTGPGVNRPHGPCRLFVVGLLALLNPQVGVVGTSDVRVPVTTSSTSAGVWPLAARNRR